MNSGYSPLVYLAMFGWIPAVLMMCAVLPPRRAVVVAFVIAWSFLPMASFKFVQGIPEYTKMSATCLGVLVAAVCFDFNRIFAFKPSVLDLPALIFCLCPIASSVSNGLGVYDGVSTAFKQSVAWGVPYFIGRLYLGDLNGMRDLALGMFFGALAYVPLCLYEIRMSPQLHHLVYGYHAHDFAQTMRFGGWRPTVFMQHGLMVGMWMGMGSLLAVWLWWTGAVKKAMGTPMILLAIAVIGTAVICKSLGALLLMAAGLGALASVKLFNTRIAMVLLILVAPAYFAARISNLWDGSQVSEIAESFSPDRAQSLVFRQQNEKMLLDKAMVQPRFGWGGWARGHVYDNTGRDLTVIDGLWIDMLSQFGLVGLVSLTLTMLLAPAILVWKVPPKLWKTPLFASVAVILVMNVLYMIDNISNAMVNPIYMLAAGGMVGFAAFGLPIAKASLMRPRGRMMRGGRPVQAMPQPAMTGLLAPAHRPRNWAL